METYVKKHIFKLIAMFEIQAFYTVIITDVNYYEEYHNYFTYPTENLNMIFPLIFDKLK